jgi:hypothetical protein
MARSRGEKGWAKRVVAQVPAKIDGVTLEQIQANLWRDGVRMIDLEVFNQILNLAGEHGPETGGRFPAEASNIKTADNSIFPPTVVAPGAGRRAPTGHRKPKRAKEICDPRRQLRPLRAFRHEPAGGHGRQRDPIQAYVIGIVTAAFARDRSALSPSASFFSINGRTRR